MKLSSLHRPVLLSALLACLSACATFGPPSSVPPHPPAARAEDVLAADLALAKARFVELIPITEPLTPDNGGAVVELDQQRVYLYQRSQLVAVSKISSGRRNHRTETGLFSVASKDPKHRSNIYGDFVDTASGDVVLGNVDARLDAAPAGAVFKGASMANFVRLAYGGKPSPIGFHAGMLPGYPASHGCLRLPRQTSEYFIKNLPTGLPVLVLGEKFGVPHGARQAGSPAKKRPAPPVETPAADPATPPAPAPLETPPAAEPPAAPAPANPVFD